MTLTCRFKFPSILLAYHISIPIILDLTHFTGLAGRHSLFCRSTSLFGDPTPFCSFIGAELAFSLYILICLQVSNKSPAYYIDNIIIYYPGIITGVVYHFVYTSISIVWIFLILMVFWKVWFPIHARRF